MEKLRSTRGFALLETMTVLLIISIMLLTTPFMYPKDFEVYGLISDYAYQQFLAIKNIEKRGYNSDHLFHHHPIAFNEKGNINLSQTLIFRKQYNEETLVIYLGGGRIEIK
jgi:prepilin-type N-terminal cleavage/methylation domain-containing protein